MLLLVHEQYLKVQCKQSYRLLKIRKFNAYKNDLNGTTTGFRLH